MSNKTKMSHSRRSMTKHSFRSRFTDGEFPPIRSIPPTDNLLMEYLCQFRENNEISTEEYKEYVDDQLDRIRENNATMTLTKLGGKNYCNAFVTVKIEHVATEHEFYGIPVCDIEQRFQFQGHLNDTYNTFCEPFHEIKVKYLCAVYIDGKWCRGEIVATVAEMHTTVYLLDYGRTVEVTPKELCMLKFAHAMIRPFVIKCQLSILNDVAQNLSTRTKRRLYSELVKMARKTKSVCIYLNEPISKNSDTYTDVLLLTHFQSNVHAQCKAYSLHEAYGAFYCPKIRFDNEMCKQWLNDIDSMENAINSNTKRKVSVFLTHIESPKEFYVHSVPVKLFMSKIRRIIDAYACAQIVNYDFNAVNWQIGDNCLVRLQNWKTQANLKLWYRGKIIETIKAGAAQCTFKVLLRDYGRRTEVNRLDLMTISPELAACPNASQKCTLDISKQWIASAKDLFTHLVEKYHTFAISRARKIESNMYVDLWASNSSSPNVNIFDTWENIGYTIVCTAIRKSMQPFILESQHDYNTLKRIQDEDNSNIHLSSDEETDDKIPNALTVDHVNEDNNDENNVYTIKSDLLAHEPIVTKWIKSTAPEHNTFRGMVTHITNRGVIYVQEEANHELAHDISATISSQMLNVRNVRIPFEWKPGDACFAEYEVNQYHRAVIKRIYREQGTCLIKYVDFGTKDIRKLEDLQLATMFKDLPILVHRCFIPKVKSTSKTGQWSPVILQSFKKHILQEFCAVRIESDIHGFKQKKFLPSLLDPIYQPQHAYDWLRKEQLAIHTGLDAENNEILYVG